MNHRPLSPKSRNERSPGPLVPRVAIECTVIYTKVPKISTGRRRVPKRQAQVQKFQARSRPTRPHETGVLFKLRSCILMYQRKQSQENPQTYCVRVGKRYCFCFCQIRQMQSRETIPGVAAKEPRKSRCCGTTRLLVGVSRTEFGGMMCGKDNVVSDRWSERSSRPLEGLSTLSACQHTLADPGNLDCRLPCLRNLLGKISRVSSAHENLPATTKLPQLRLVMIHLAYETQALLESNSETQWPDGFL